MRAGAGLRHASALALLLVTSSLLPTLAAPPVVQEAPVLCKVGDRPAVVTVTVPTDKGEDGKPVRIEFGVYKAFSPEDCLFFPGETDPLGNKVYLVQPYKPGVYRVAFVTKGEVQFSELVIDAQGTAPPKPKVDPKVEPAPPPKPKPEPIVAKGLRVVFWYENRPNSTFPRLTPEQAAVVFSGKVEEYLNARCAQVDNQPEWRRWDQNVVLADDESQTMRDLHAGLLKDLEAKTAAGQPYKLPLMLVANDLGVTVYPLPSSEVEALAILKKHGGE